jgi:hypothetical protein
MSSSAPAKSTRKRGAVAEPAAEEVPARRNKKSNGGLAESQLNGAAGEAVVLKMKKDREYWSQYSTELLSVWTLDYEKHKPDDDRLRDRSWLIDTLVSSDWSIRPDGSTKAQQLKVVQSVYSKHRPRVAAADIPGWFVPAPVREPIDPVASSKSGRKPADVEDDDDDEEMEPALPALASPSAPAARRIEFESGSAAKPVAPSARNNASDYFGLMAPTPIAHQCLSCCLPRPSVGLSAYSTAWICPGCNLRGDLDASAPFNAHLMRQIEIRAAAAASSSASSSSSGQSKNDTSSASAAVGALDKEYARRSEELPPFDLFTGLDAGLGLSHTAALKMSREALGAAQSQIPSESLIRFIRSGFMWKIGHAIPRAINRGIAEDGLGLVQDGSNVFKLESKQTAPPDQCASMQSFFLAMVSHILPALIDRPKAMMNWIVLARTALDIESRLGWPAASEYVTQMLQERTASRQSFIEVDRNILTSISYAKAAPTQMRSGPSLGGPVPSPSLQQPQSVCFDFNRGGCSRGASCFRRHVCQVCSQSHAASSVPGCSARLPQQQPRPPGGGGRGFRSGGNPSSASSVGTLKTDAQSAKGKPE